MVSTQKQRNSEEAMDVLEFDNDDDATTFVRVIIADALQRHHHKKLP
jgi:hypothetical protein